MKESLVVRQFMALARKEIPVQVPARFVPEARVARVVVEFRVCASCATAGEQDVIEFDNRMTWAVCRACCAVHENNRLEPWRMVDGYVERVSE
jgi:hypothetical protein